MLSVHSDLCTKAHDFMFSLPPPPAFSAEHVTPSPKRRRLDLGVGENHDPNAPAESACKDTPASASGALSCLSEQQRVRIEQNRLAALEKKQQALTECPSSEGADADKRARIEQNRLAALARKQQREAAGQLEKSSDCQTANLDAALHAKIEQNRAAALARKQQKATACADQISSAGQEQLPQECKDPCSDEVFIPPLQDPCNDEVGSDDDDDSPSIELSLQSNSDDVSDGSGSSRSSSSDRNSTSSSDGSDSSSSDSSDSEQTGTPSGKAPALTAEQLAKIAQNRRAAVARKKGLTSEQIARMEENRRIALARKRGLDPKQLERIEENRRKALERRMKKKAPEAATEEKAIEDVKEQVDDGWKLPPGVPEPKPVEERDARHTLVAQLLCRWWFALPPWPPENYDFDSELLKRRFRRIPINVFDQHPEFDEQGFRKAYELEQFKGCFRTSDGLLLDLRPIEGRPSYDQFMLKSTPELYRLLIKALDCQLMELFAETQKKGASQDHEVYLKDLRKQAAKVRQKATFFMWTKPKSAPQK